ncbi:MAG: RNA polymerase sigma factor [Alicyclobacillus sp.]|nr:RNA polymerase sigma factor [Alicyclobacillus sp.]
MRCPAGMCQERFCEFGCLREYEGLVRNLVYHITHNPNDVDDLTQEILVKAYQSRNAFRGGNFRAYLCRIARNHCYDALRKRRLRSEVTLEDAAVEQWAVSAETPETVALADESTREVYALLTELGETDREILVMRHLNDMSYQEIAEVMGMQAGAVRTRVSRARQKVQELLERRAAR